MNRKKIVAVGVLVLSAVAGVTGTAVADQPPPPHVTVDQEGDKVEISVVSEGNADSVSLVAPNGNQSFEIPNRVGMKVTVVETPENRTVPAENYFTTEANKTEEQMCWVDQTGMELREGIRVNESVDIPCSGGEIAGPQNLTAVGGSEGTVLIEPGQKIRYQDGTYEIRALFEGRVAGTESFTVGTDDTDDTLYNIIGIITVAALLAMQAILVAVGYREWKHE